nr:hypothetical protein BgiMline_016926 [Biomphalaria glabrata]
MVRCSSPVLVVELAVSHYGPLFKPRSGRGVSGVVVSHYGPLFKPRPGRGGSGVSLWSAVQAPSWSWR